MSFVQKSAKSLKGLSFSIPDLILIRGRAEANGLRMVVRLDHGSDSEAFEEALALHVGDSPSCRWLMWRDASAFYLQPLIGRSRRYATAEEALASLSGHGREDLTDIRPARWPVNLPGFAR